MDNTDNTIQEFIKRFIELGLCESESTENAVLNMDVELSSGRIIHDAEIISVHEKYFDGRRPRKYFMVEDYTNDGIEEIELGEYLHVKESVPGHWVAVVV